MRKLLAIVAVMLVFACKGPEGRVGPKGDTGAPGAAGKDGSGLSAYWDCSKATANYSLGYRVYEFSDGSVMATCDVEDAAISGSRTFLWKSTQSGSQTGACMLTYDLNSPMAGGWFDFALTKTTNAGSATYHESGSTLDGQIMPLTCTKY